jgi:hypothetical protein
VSHNAYTQVASELGLAAFYFYVSFIVTPLRRLGRIERATLASRRASGFYYLSVGLQASLAAYMVSSFFGSVAYHWYIYYLVGFAVALRRVYATTDEVKEVASETFAEESRPNSLGAPAPAAPPQGDAAEAPARAGSFVLYDARSARVVTE